MFGVLLFGEGPIGKYISIIFGDWYEVISVTSEILREVTTNSLITQTIELTSDCLTEFSVSSVALAQSEAKKF